jgi:hypothetical protein
MHFFKATFSEFFEHGQCNNCGCVRAMPDQDKITYEEQCLSYIKRPSQTGIARNQSADSKHSSIFAAYICMDYIGIQ